MQLKTPTFCLNLEALRRPDHEDWARVRVTVQVGGFSGNFDAWLCSRDLDIFSSELGHLYESVGRPGMARLQCDEPGIKLSLEMERSGGVVGQYEFFDELGDATLFGTIKIDQSYLPLWRHSVQSFAEELRQLAR